MTDVRRVAIDPWLTQAEDGSIDKTLQQTLLEVDKLNEGGVWTRARRAQIMNMVTTMKTKSDRSKSSKATLPRNKVKLPETSSSVTLNKKSSSKNGKISLNKEKLASPKVSTAIEKTAPLATPSSSRDKSSKKNVKNHKTEVDSTVTVKGTNQVPNRRRRIPEASIEYVVPELPKDGVFMEESSKKNRKRIYTEVWESHHPDKHVWKADKQLDDFYERKERSYGEITVSGMTLLFDHLKLHSKDRLLDIGSGLGNFILFASFVYGIEKAYGIEIQRDRHEYAEFIKSNLSASAAATKSVKWDPDGVQLICNDKHRDVNTIPGIKQTLDGITYVFINNIVFQPDTMAQLIKFTEDLPSLNFVLILTSNPWPRESAYSLKKGHNPFVLWKKISIVEAASWCATPVNFFFFTSRIYPRAPEPDEVLQTARSIKRQDLKSQEIGYELSDDEFGIQKSSISPVPAKLNKKPKLEEVKTRDQHYESNPIPVPTPKFAAKKAKND